MNWHDNNRQSAHAALFDNEGKLLVVKGFFYPKGSQELVASDRWMLPGGCREPEDNVLLDTCRRELKEETGIVPGQYSELIPVSGFQWGNPPRQDTIFLGALMGRPTLKLQEDEIHDHAWLSQNEIAKAAFINSQFKTAAEQAFSFYNALRIAAGFVDVEPDLPKEEPEKQRYSAVKVTSLLFGKNKKGKLSVLAIKKFYNPKNSRFQKDRIPSQHWKAPKDEMSSTADSPKSTQRECLSKLLGLKEQDYRFDLLVSDEVRYEVKNGVGEWVRNLVFAGELIGTPQASKREVSKMVMLTRGQVNKCFSKANKYKTSILKAFDMWKTHLDRPKPKQSSALEVFRELSK